MGGSIRNSPGAVLVCDCDSFGDSTVRRTGRSAQKNRRRIKNVVWRTFRPPMEGTVYHRGWPRLSPAPACPFGCGLLSRRLPSTVSESAYSAWRIPLAPIHPVTEVQSQEWYLRELLRLAFRLRVFPKFESASHAQRSWSRSPTIDPRGKRRSCDRRPKFAGTFLERNLHSGELQRMGRDE